MSEPKKPPKIDCVEALAIAHADAVQVYGDSLTRHRVEVHLEHNGWIVDYHFRGEGKYHTGGAPYYVIHPQTGEIVTKTYHQ